MNFLSKAFRFLVSCRFNWYLTGFFLILVIALLLFAKLVLWDVLALVPSLLSVALILLNRCFGLIFEIKKKSIHAFTSAGIIILVSGLLLNCFLRFEGTKSVGEGESFAGTDFDSSTKGSLSDPPVFAFQVNKVDGDPLNFDNQVTVALADRERSAHLSPGQSLRWSPSKQIHVMRVEPAPRFLISDQKGRELHSAFTKLHLYPKGAEDYFISPVVPHRFYVSLTGNHGKPLHVRIMRGKLIIEQKEMAIGETLTFEGFKISFPEIVSWGEIRASYYPGDIIIALGLIVVLAGSTMSLIRRSGKD